MLFQVLQAANFLNLKPLLDLACLRVTFELENRNADEVSSSAGRRKKV